MTTDQLLPLRDRARAALSALVGREADFHDGQFEAIADVVEHRRRVLVVQRTGWGKSAVYFVATRLLREQGAGPTVIISPLLALMRDQVAAAGRAGITALSMNSANAHEWGDVREALMADRADVLLVSPERLNNPAFRAEVLPDLAKHAGLIVVDEAHCISDWGHDFRPDYRRIRDLLHDLPPGIPVLATTATANERVMGDVADQLGAGGLEVTVHRGPLARASLRLGVLPLPTPEQGLAWLMAHLEELPGSGIIYALTVSAAQDTAALLARAGHAVKPYTGRTDPAERETLETELRENRVKALVATSALGMGFDKPDLGFVVHLGAPSSPVSYYQQVGRAGRATDNADVLLLPSPSDREIWAYFASASMPRADQAAAVLDALGAARGAMSTAALETITNVRRTRLELLLKVLDVDGAVTRVSGGWVATGAGWVYDAERYERVAATRVAEAQSMLDYQRTPGCRMKFLAQALDDPAAADCGRCDRCSGEWFSSEIPEVARDSARQQLSQVGVEIPARNQWPTGMNRLGVEVRGRISGDEACGTGRVVARFTDLGWGQRVRELLAESTPDGPADAALLGACVSALASWGWAERPVAIVAMPSARRPQLINSVARHLSQVGRLPFAGTLSYASGPAPAGAGGNSAFRLAGVWDRFVAGPELVEALADLPAGPVLLIDDQIDSRWSVTVAARALRLAGVPSVLPFALATPA